MRRIACVTLSACSVLALCPVFGIVAGAQPAPKSASEAAAMFRHLDSNGDGQITMSDANDRNRRNVEAIFQLAGKSNSDAISREEFQQVFDRQRQKSAGPGTTKPSSAADPEPRTAESDGELRLTRAAE